MKIGDGETVEVDSTTEVFLEKLSCSREDGKYKVHMYALDIEMPEAIAVDFMESICSMLDDHQTMEIMRLLVRMFHLLPDNPGLSHPLI